MIGMYWRGKNGGWHCKHGRILHGDSCVECERPSAPTPITHNTFPKQSDWLNRLVKVCFDYDTAHTLDGMVIRCDAEAPGLMLIRLEDGRVVRSTECQYSFPPGEKH